MKDSVPEIYAGKYDLRVIEVNPIDEADYIWTDVTLYLHHMCSLCAIYPKNLDIKIDEMDLETLTVPFTWHQFSLVPRPTILGSNLVDENACEKFCQPFVSNVTISTNFW